MFHKSLVPGVSTRTPLGRSVLSRRIYAYCHMPCQGMCQQDMFSWVVPMRSSRRVAGVKGYALYMTRHFYHSTGTSQTRKLHIRVQSTPRTRGAPLGQSQSNVS